MKHIVLLQKNTMVNMAELNNCGFKPDKCREIVDAIAQWEECLYDRRQG